MPPVRSRQVIAKEGCVESYLLLIVGGEVEAQVAHGVTVDSFSLDPRDLETKGGWMTDAGAMRQRGLLPAFEQLAYGRRGSCSPWSLP
jgi:hypothetical protein